MTIERWSKPIKTRTREFSTVIEDSVVWATKTETTTTMLRTMREMKARTGIRTEMRSAIDEMIVIMTDDNGQVITRAVQITILEETNGRICTEIRTEMRSANVEVIRIELIETRTTNDHEGMKQVNAFWK